ncbi:MAG: hypothetical protein ABI548_11875 [Polyangiaceae bacterium]
MVTKLSSFRFTPEDLQVLGVVHDHVGAQSKTETLRVVLKSFARTEGLDLEHKRPKPKKVGK